MLKLIFLYLCRGASAAILLLLPLTGLAQYNVSVTPVVVPASGDYDAREGLYVSFSLTNLGGPVSLRQTKFIEDEIIYVGFTSETYGFRFVATSNSAGNSGLDATIVNLNDYLEAAVLGVSQTIRLEGVLDARHEGGYIDDLTIRFQVFSVACSGGFNWSAACRIVDIPVVSRQYTWYGGNETQVGVPIPRHPSIYSRPIVNSAVPAGAPAPSSTLSCADADWLVQNRLFHFWGQWGWYRNCPGF